MVEKYKAEKSELKMANKNKDKNFYSTSSFYPACFLLCNGLQLININRGNPRRCEFVFQDSPEREKWLKDFNFAEEDTQEVLVDARKLINAIKTLKERLYQDR